MNNAPIVVPPVQKLVLKPLTAAQLDKARQTLAAGRHIARQRAPYFQSIILKLVVREVPPSPSFMTVGVTDRLVMLTCMEYVATLTPEQMAGDFLHESLHVLEHHNRRRGVRDPSRWNIAADLAINTIVRDMRVQQTPVALWPKDYGFEDNLSADAYYALLEEKEKKDGKSGKTKPGEGQPGEGQPGEGQPGEGQPGEGQGPGKTGTARQRSLRLVRRRTLSRASPSPTTPIQTRAAKPMSRSPCATSPTRSKPKQARAVGPSQRACSCLLTKRLHLRRSLGRGSFQRVVRGACAWASGSVSHRYDQPGRRQACVGYGVGRPVLPRLRRPMPRVAFVLDTSGSMGNGPNSALAQGVTEAMGVIKALGAEVDFIAVDSRVHVSKKVRNVADLLASVKGGGGTSFVPGFEAAEALRPAAHIVIYCTDGYGDAPPLPPKGLRVIWLLIGPGAPVPAPYGDVVRIED